MKKLLVERKHRGTSGLVRRNSQTDLNNDTNRGEKKVLNDWGGGQPASAVQSQWRSPTKMRDVVLYVKNGRLSLERSKNRYTALQRLRFNDHFKCVKKKIPRAQKSESLRAFCVSFDTNKRRHELLLD